MSNRLSRIYVKGTVRDQDGGQTVGAAFLTCVLKSEFPEDAVVVFGDATLDLQSLPPDLRRRFIDISPKGLPEQLQQVIQYPVDVTKQTAEAKVIALVRALLKRYPDASRIGIITHSCLTDLFEGDSCQLDKHEKERIVKVDYFFGKESRGSNSWKRECDALFIIGTPRRPLKCVPDHLLQCGEPETARRDGEWSLDYWSGRRLDGTRQTVRTRGYRDHDWNRAYRQLVHAELIQTVGRSRCCNKDGIPLTVVLTTEDLGFPLANEPLFLIDGKTLQTAVPIFVALLGLDIRDPQPPTSSAGRSRKSVSSSRKNQPGKKRQGVRGLTARNAINITLKQILPLAHRLPREEHCRQLCSPKTATDLAKDLGKSDRTVRKQLADLEALGLVARHSSRGGYHIDLEHVEMLAAAVGALSVPRTRTRHHGSKPSVPIPAIRYWSPGDPRLKGDRFSLVLGVSEQGLLAETVVACAGNGHDTVLIRASVSEVFSGTSPGRIAKLQKSGLLFLLAR